MHHPLAVLLLLQQELHSVVQFPNDLISTFSILSLEFSPAAVRLSPHYSLFLAEFYSTSS